MLQTSLMWNNEPMLGWDSLAGRWFVMNMRSALGRVLQGALLAKD
jgi:hypothetical protein